MYTCMQCLIEGIPSQHSKVHVQYDDAYTAVATVDQSTGREVYTLGHSDTCPSGHKIASTPLQIGKAEAEQLKGTKVEQKA